MTRISRIASRLASGEVPTLRPYLGAEVTAMATETIYMGINGPETDTTEQLIAKAAEILGVEPGAIWGRGAVARARRP